MENGLPCTVDSKLREMKERKIMLKEARVNLFIGETDDERDKVFFLCVN